MTDHMKKKEIKNINYKSGGNKSKDRLNEIEGNNDANCERYNTNIN